MTDYVAKPKDGAAWVTGASSGIGRAVAERLAREGFTVFVTARSAEALDDLAEAAGRTGGAVVAKPGDVTDAAAMRRIAEDIVAENGKLALAVFNAGVFQPVHGECLDRAVFEKTFTVNLMGVVNGLAPAIDIMKGEKRGHIVIVSSVTGYGGLPTSAAYGASKAALINMAESLKFDLDKLGIRIQVVNPGFVDTPATRKNPFKMPALMPVEAAAERLVRGLGGSGFEITFPRRFTYWLKALQLLPYPAYFGLVARATGWRKRPLKTSGTPAKDGGAVGEDRQDAA